MTPYLEYLYSFIDRSGRYGSVADERICEALSYIAIPRAAFDKNPYDRTRLDDILGFRKGFLDNYAAEGNRFEANEADILMENPFTLFELLVTLAVKIEQIVMQNTIYGNRTPIWFWMMLENLDITYQTVCRTDGTIDLEYIAAVADRWLNREYCKNGDGSPFPMKKTVEDTRKLPFWKHAMLYFSENFEGKW